jgi:hypothetical protein
MNHEVAIRQLEEAIRLRTTQAREYRILQGTFAEKQHYNAESDRVQGEALELRKAVEILEAAQS